MRYTKKITKNYGCKMNDYMWKDNSYNHSRLGIDKLGMLEDIEEGLGIDLIELLSAKEIYTYQYDEPIKDFCIDFNKKTISDYYKSDIDSTFSFDDYGKYWAFTKEELKEQ